MAWIRSMRLWTRRPDSLGRIEQRDGLRELQSQDRRSGGRDRAHRRAAGDEIACALAVAGMTSVSTPIRTATSGPRDRSKRRLLTSMPNRCRHRKAVRTRRPQQACGDERTDRHDDRDDSEPHTGIRPRAARARAGCRGRARRAGRHDRDRARRSGLGRARLLRYRTRRLDRAVPWLDQAIGIRLVCRPERLSSRERGPEKVKGLVFADRDRAAVDHPMMD